MAVGKTDRLLESAISRGLGQSGSTSRRIQQLNIDELKNLRANVAQSEAVLRNQSVRQNNVALSKALKNRGLGALRSNRGSAGNVNSAGQTVIASYDNKSGYLLRGHDGAGFRLDRRFKDENQFKQEVEALQKAGIQIAFQGAPELREGTEFNSKVIQDLGVNRVSIHAGQKLLHGKARGGLFNSIRTFTSKVEPKETANSSVQAKSTREARQSLSPRQVAQSSLKDDQLTQNEKARIRDAALNQVLSSNFTNPPLKNFVLEALQQGNLGAVRDFFGRV